MTRQKMRKRKKKNKENWMIVMDYKRKPFSQCLLDWIDLYTRVNGAVYVPTCKMNSANEWEEMSSLLDASLFK